MTSVMIDTFRTLRERFPSWAELKTHFTSAEGGSLRVIEPPPGSSIAVVRYVKGQSPLTGLARQFRSVCWDTERNIPVSVAPFKAMEGAPPTNQELSVNQFIDGIMINVFVMESVEGRKNLQLATRTSLGGANKFYGTKPFGDMFHEALATTPLKTREALAEALGDYSFASFVLQHPDHRIVAKVVRPALHLVHLGKVDSIGNVSISLHPSQWPRELKALEIPAVPRLYIAEKEMEDTMQRMAIQEGWRWQGLCFHDQEGNRWRMRSPTYTMLRELRGSEADGLDRFLRLRAAHKVGEYLKHYSEERTSFWEFEKQLRKATESVLAAYVDCHKAHAVSFKELPIALQPAVYMLHIKWLQELRAKGYVIRLQNAIEVVNSMRPFEQKRIIETEYTPVAKSLKAIAEATQAASFAAEAAEHAGRVARQKANAAAAEAANREAVVEALAAAAVEEVDDMTHLPEIH